MKVIMAKIDVTKVDKNRLFKGEKGTYLDVVLLENEKPDQFGNEFTIRQSVKKEEREAGIYGTILGSAKYLKRSAAPKEPTPTPAATENDDVPF